MPTTRAHQRVAAIITGVVATALFMAPGVAGTPAHAAADYQAKPGAYFETPSNRRITNLLLRNIENTPRNAYIRVVSWSFTSGEISRALSAAADRGVVVRVLMSRGQIGGTAETLRSRLRAHPGSWLRGAKNAARGPNSFDGKRTALHQKSWTFSTTGASKRVSIVTSGNPTDHARDAQFFDAYQFVGKEGVYNKLRDVFVEQTKDDGGANPYLRWSRKRLGLVFSPWNSPSMDDPVVGRIQNLPNHARLRIANSAWWGPRGLRIAQAVAAHERSQAGRDVWVLASKPLGSDVRRVLRGAGIPVYKGWWKDDRYHHHKYMTARWRGADGKPRTRVWTGSENWSNASRGNDELVLRVHGFKAHERYVAFFDKVAALPD